MQKIDFGDRGHLQNALTGNCSQSFFHLHIPKTAGDSFQIDAPRALPDAFTIESAETCLPAVPDRQCRPIITLFREPGAHVYSQFVEIKYSPAGQFHQRNLMDPKNLPALDNITTWLSHFRAGAVTKDFGLYYPYNMQARALTCSGQGSELTTNPQRKLFPMHHYSPMPSMTEVLTSFESLFFVGLVEHYQASWCVLYAKAHDMQSQLPAYCNCSSVDWASFPQTHVRHDVPPHSLADLSHEDRSMIDELTQMDSHLYRAATQRFMREVSKVETHFHVKLLC